MPQQELRMKLVAVFTEIGFSAGLVSKYPPRAPMAVGLAIVRATVPPNGSSTSIFSRHQRGASLLSDSS